MLELFPVSSVPMVNLKSNNNLLNFHILMAIAKNLCLDTMLGHYFCAARCLRREVAAIFHHFCGTDAGHLGGHLECTCRQLPWLKSNDLVEFLIPKNLCFDTNFVKIAAFKRKLQHSSSFWQPSWRPSWWPSWRPS